MRLSRIGEVALRLALGLGFRRGRRPAVLLAPLRKALLFRRGPAPHLLLGRGFGLRLDLRLGLADLGEPLLLVGHPSRHLIATPVAVQLPPPHRRGDRHTECIFCRRRQPPFDAMPRDYMPASTPRETGRRAKPGHSRRDRGLQPERFPSMAGRRVLLEQWHGEENRRLHQAASAGGRGQSVAAHRPRARPARTEHHGILQGFQRQDLADGEGHPDPGGDHGLSGPFLHFRDEAAADVLLSEEGGKAHERLEGARSHPGRQGDEGADPRDRAGEAARPELQQRGIRNGHGRGLGPLHGPRSGGVTR